MKNYERKNTKMMPAICTQCGGQVMVDAQRETTFCQYCGTQLIVEKAINTYNVQHATVEHVDSINIFKTSAVESVLNFVKDQQQRIDEEKKAKKEEERKEKEESEKSFKKYWWIYLLMVLIPLVLLNFMSSEEEKINKISINHSSSQLVGKNYKDVVVKLQENGFINIKTEAVEDLIVGLFTEDGEVEQVEINGNIDFSSGAKFPEDAEIIVSYHTFPTTK